MAKMICPNCRRRQQMIVIYEGALFKGATYGTYQCPSCHYRFRYDPTPDDMDRAYKEYNYQNPENLRYGQDRQYGRQQKPTFQTPTPNPIKSRNRNRLSSKKFSSKLTQKPPQKQKSSQKSAINCPKCKKNQLIKLSSWQSIFYGKRYECLSCGYLF